VREQMMYTEDRKLKVTLLRLELAQYQEIAINVQSEINITLYRFDVSAFKVLLAEVCSFIPSSFIRTMLNIPLKANLLNRRLQNIYGINDWTTVANISRELDEFHRLCESVEASLKEIFGPLGQERAQ